MGTTPLVATATSLLISFHRSRADETPPSRVNACAEVSPHGEHALSARRGRRGAIRLGSDLATGKLAAGLPTLHGSVVTMRELRRSDAAPLFASMAAEDVRRFISPPPPTVERFETFIDWSHRQREAGQSVCFAMAARDTDIALGLFQVRSLEADFSTAGWGFALGVEHWGKGIFAEGADLAVDFAFEVLGVRRLEARTAVQNGRGNAVLKTSARPMRSCYADRSP